MSISPPSPHDCLGAAQRDAVRMHGAAPPPAWHPRAHRAWRPWLLAGLVLTLGATTAVLAARQLNPVPAASQAMEPAPRPSVPAAPAAMNARPSPVPALAAAVREQRIERVGDAWVIDVAGLSREQAAQRLAGLTGGVLLERPELLAQTPALTLSWRGRDAGEAWRQLLGDEVGHALQCAAQACRVWVLAPAERSAAAALAGPAAAVAVTTPERVARAAAPEPQPFVPPTGETAAAPMQPDPPGLFPSPPDGG